MTNLAQEVVNKIEQDLFERGMLPPEWDTFGKEIKESWLLWIQEAMIDYGSYVP